MTTKRFRLCIILFSILVLISLIIVITLLTVKSIDDVTPESNFLCDVNETISLETSSDFHIPCSTSVNIVENCAKVKHPTWRSFNSQSQDWSSVVDLVPSSGDNFTSFLVSPYFALMKESCSLHFSFNVQSQTPLRAFIVTSSNVTERAIGASGTCGADFIDHRGLLPTEGDPRVRIVIASTSSIDATRDANVTVTSQSCVGFEGLRMSGRSAAPGRSLRVRGGTRNTCSLEVVNGTRVGCDWLNARGVDNADFERVDTHQCVETGVNFELVETWFLALGPNAPGKPPARALLVSPVLEGGSTHLLISLWFMIKCAGPYLRVYLVPSGEWGGWFGGAEVAEVSDPGISNGWHAKSFKVPIPKNYKNFQVVIEGVVPSGGSCANHYCYVMDSSWKNASGPLLVLDDIVLETLNEECKLNERTTPAKIDCTFDNHDNSSTYCNWTSSCPATPCFESFQAWQTTKQTAGDHALTLQNRFGGSEAKYFRSPLVVANSNCACSLTFRYFIRGFLIPNLEVNLVVGDDVRNKMRRRVRQWWFHGGLGTDSWRTSSVVLNLWRGRPFQVELCATMSDVATMTQVHVDDLTFNGCDISHY